MSIQITLTALLMLSALGLVLRLLRRGEAEVLGEEPQTQRLFDPDALVPAARLSLRRGVRLGAGAPGAFCRRRPRLAPRWCSRAGAGESPPRSSTASS